MKTLEEQLWNYIDGNCDAEETAAIKVLLSADTAAHNLYRQFLEINNYLLEMETDAPSMSFTRNVMDKVSLEVAPVALKTRTDKRIIYSIAGLFIAALLSIFVYALVNSDMTLELTLPSFKTPFRTEAFLNPLFLKIFLFADVALALIYFDGILRRKNAQKKGTTQ